MIIYPFFLLILEYNARYEKNSFVQQASFYNSAFNFASEHISWQILGSGVLWLFQRTCLKRWNNTHGFPRSPDILAYGHFLSFAITLGNLRRAVLMPFSSKLKNYVRGEFELYKLLKLSRYLGTWTTLKPRVLRRLYFSCILVENFCLLQKLISQSFPAIFPFVQSVFNTAPLRIKKG
jgi:hypothetical protein